MVPVLLACSSTDSMSNHIMPALDVRAVSMVTVLPTLGRCVFFFFSLSPTSCPVRAQSCSLGWRQDSLKEYKKQTAASVIFIFVLITTIFFFQAALAPFLYFCRPLPPFKSQLCLFVIISSRLSPCPFHSLQNTFSSLHSRCVHFLRLSC